MYKIYVLTYLTALLVGGVSQPLLANQGPSYECAKTPADSIEEMICEDTRLSALDRTLAEVYIEAQKKALNEQPAQLKPEQRGWIAGRNDCWKQNDKHSCVANAYTRRIAELQARYRLADITAVITFACENDRDNELVVVHFATEPATLIADYGDSVSLMYRQPGVEDVQYVGRNESIIFKEDQAVVVWGYQVKPMLCETLE